ncbi:MAG: lipoyl(octanoyl) transferase LipB [Robiginitomaculum sp.]|nr:lipoyl(octanoyl) transferase LipB [Robiginitomaculum sp.]
MNKPPSIFSPAPVSWQSASAPVGYLDAVAVMEAWVAAIAAGDAHQQAKELIWTLEHPALYSAGTSADISDLIDPDRFPVFKTGRGGQYTYHGPGQLVGYFMLDLKTRGRDVRAYVAGLEQLVIDTLADFGVAADRRAGRVGVWVDMPDKSEAKIAAVGVRIRKWVSYHGISININPDLSHFDGIVPCGISEHGVTSLHALGIEASRADVEAVLKNNSEKIFGPIGAPNP